MIAVRPAPLPVEAGDEALIRQAQAGDRDAFGELYQRHQPAVLHFALSRLDNLADAEDIVAETFATALSTINAFRGEADFVDWLVGIARNKTLMRWDWRRRHPETELPPDWDPVLSAQGPGPEEATCLRLELAQLLSTMTPRTRRVMVHLHLVGLSVDEVARNLGLSRWTVWYHSSQASAALTTPASKKRTRVLPPALCACGCGVQLPADRRARQRCATRACRDRLRRAARLALQQHHLTAPAAADPAIDRVLAVIAAAGPDGITRRALGRHTRLQAARLDRIFGLLRARRLAYQRQEPSTGNRPVTRYFALSQPTVTRAA